MSNQAIRYTTLCLYFVLAIGYAIYAVALFEDILFVKGNTSLTFFVYGNQRRTVTSMLQSLRDDKSYVPLFLLICFTIIVPVIKFIFSFFCFLLSTFTDKMHRNFFPTWEMHHLARLHLRILSFLRLISKYQLVDFQITIITIVLIAGDFLDVGILNGTYCFFTYCAISMCVTELLYLLYSNVPSAAPTLEEHHLYLATLRTKYAKYNEEKTKDVINCDSCRTQNNLSNFQMNMETNVIFNDVSQTTHLLGKARHYNNCCSYLFLSILSLFSYSKSVIYFLFYTFVAIWAFRTCIYHPILAVDFVIGEKIGSITVARSTATLLDIRNKLFQFHFHYLIWFLYIFAIIVPALSLFIGLLCSLLHFYLKITKVDYKLICAAKKLVAHESQNVFVSDLIDIPEHHNYSSTVESNPLLKLNNLNEIESDNTTNTIKFTPFVSALPKSAEYLINILKFFTEASLSMMTFNLCDVFALGCLVAFFCLSAIYLISASWPADEMSGFFAICTLGVATFGMTFDLEIIRKDVHQWWNTARFLNPSIPINKVISNNITKGDGPFESTSNFETSSSQETVKEEPQFTTNIAYNTILSYKYKEIANKTLLTSFSIMKIVVVCILIKFTYTLHISPSALNLDLISENLMSIAKTIRANSVQANFVLGDCSLAWNSSHKPCFNAKIPFNLYDKDNFVLTNIVWLSGFNSTHLQSLRATLGSTPNRIIVRGQLDTRLLMGLSVFKCSHDFLCTEHLNNYVAIPKSPLLKFEISFDCNTENGLPILQNASLDDFKLSKISFYSKELKRNLSIDHQLQQHLHDLIYFALISDMAVLPYKGKTYTFSQALNYFANLNHPFSHYLCPNFPQM